MVEFGFVVKEFGFRRLVLPESTTKEVANRMKEERNRLAEEYRSQGAKESKIKRNQADAFRQEKIIFAEARAKEIEGEAFAQIADEYKVFAKDKKLAIWLRKLESLRNILKANRSTLLLDPNTQPFDLLQNSNINNVFSKDDSTNNTKDETESTSTPEKSEEQVVNDNTDKKSDTATQETTNKNVDETSQDKSTQEKSEEVDKDEDSDADEKSVEESTANDDTTSTPQNDDDQAQEDDATSQEKESN